MRLRPQARPPFKEGSSRFNRWTVPRLGVVMVLAATGASCQNRPTDETIEKTIVGAWAFNPREQMPPEEVDDVAFVTPDQVILTFEPTHVEENGGKRGKYAEYRHTPQLANRKERWEARSYFWFVNDGRLFLQGSPEIELEVTAVSRSILRVKGFPLLPCKSEKGCALLPLAELPEGARKAPVEPYP